MIPPPMLGGNGSVAMWVRMDSSSPSRFITTFGAKRFILILRTLPGDHRLEVKVARVPQEKPISVKAKLTPDQWVHLAVTWRSRGATIIYVNGTAVGRKEKTAALKRPTGIRIGRASDTGPASPISIDELRFYSRAMLPQEIEQLVSEAEETTPPADLN